ncbi:hypothetical protein EVAR_41030_1 [Eumeta japonica]|uniref:Uncharacterized protein n=1 Tax=Eumeta variegata TaxID=151549 RepID=A0A4C1Z1W3_EUMVA|nr:hypothetical protein EVAR_41030_1 [Eumeta japonica]
MPQQHPPPPLHSVSVGAKIQAPRFEITFFVVLRSQLVFSEIGQHRLIMRVLVAHSPLHRSNSPSPPHSHSIIHPIPTQEADDALVNPLGSRVSMGGGVDLLPGGSHARLPLENI